MYNLISYRHADLMQTIKNQRKSIFLQVAIFDIDGQGDDHIDFCFVDQDEMYHPASVYAPLIFNAVENLRNELSRSWAVDSITTPIKRDDEEYNFTPKVQNNLFSNTFYDIATKLKAALPYYYRGIIDGEGRNERGSYFGTIELYIPKYQNMSNIVIHLNGKDIEAEIRGCNGNGIYMIKTEDGQFGIDEKDI